MKSKTIARSYIMQGSTKEDGEKLNIKVSISKVLKRRTVTYAMLASFMEPPTLLCAIHYLDSRTFIIPEY